MRWDQVSGLITGAKIPAMTMRFILFPLLVIPAGAVAQTSADLSSKYHQVISYELHPGVVMTPKYAADGQACEMVLEKRQKTNSGMVFGVSFSKKEVKGLVDELVPEAERGRDLTTTLNTMVDGGFIMTEYTYENVLVRVYGITRPSPASDRVIIITWPKRTCGGGPETSKAENLYLTPVEARKPRDGRAAHSIRNQQEK